MNETMIERGGGVALWRQIAERLRSEINAGRYRAGEQLPTEMALADRFGVNRHTLRRAIAELTGEGILRADRGRGTFVRTERLTYPIGERTRFSEIIAGQAREPDGEVIGSSRELATEWMAERLDVELGTPLVRLDAMRGADGVPLSFGTSWFPEARFPRLAEVYEETGTITAALSAHGVSDYTRKTTTIHARLADQDEQQRLELSPGATVMVVDAVNVDSEGRPIQLTHARFAADRIELVVKN